MADKGRREPRRLSQEEASKLLSMKQKDFTKSSLAAMFAAGPKGPPEFLPEDTLALPAGKLYSKAALTTTVGRVVFNIFVLGDELLPLVGYCNEVLTKKNFEKFDSKLSALLLEDKLSPRQFADYLDRLNWLSFTITPYMGSPITYSSLEPLKSVEKRKKELMREHRAAIEAGDPLTITKIGKELEKLAYEELKAAGDEGLDFYESGAGKDFGNVYKNVSIMRGTINDQSRPGKYHVSFDNLFDGISKEDYHKYADLSIDASYSRGVGTQDGGYDFKVYSSAFQGIVLGPPGSDCGTKKAVRVLVTDFNKGTFRYRYVMQGGKPVLVEDASVLVGKYADFRSPMYCLSERICSKCAGELYYKLGIENIGLVCSRIPSKIMAMSMKKFHDTTIKTKKLDLTSYVSEA